MEADIHGSYSLRMNHGLPHLTIPITFFFFEPCSSRNLSKKQIRAMRPGSNPPDWSERPCLVAMETAFIEMD